MAEIEGTYEYECMRAELLGLARPTRQEFEETQKLRDETEKDEEEIEKMKVNNFVYILQSADTVSLIRYNFFNLKILGNRFE